MPCPPRKLQTARKKFFRSLFAAHARLRDNDSFILFAPPARSSVNRHDLSRLQRIPRPSPPREPRPGLDFGAGRSADPGLRISESHAKLRKAEQRKARLLVSIGKRRGRRERRAIYLSGRRSFS